MWHKKREIRLFLAFNLISCEKRQGICDIESYMLLRFGISSARNANLIMISLAKLGFPATMDASL